jgi:hypothetical protein
MDETMGLRFIEELKNDPEMFCKERKPYALLQEYFKGFSKETLRALFYFENKDIRQVAIWITSELGRNGIDLLKEVVTQVNDADPHIRFWAMEIVAHFAFGEYFDEFIKVISYLEHSDQKIRRSVMLIISGLSGSRIHEACVYLANKNILSDSHKKGLLSLVDVNALTPPEITHMIESDDAIIRKYGIVAARKLYKKYPQIIDEAMNAQDLDVREFSKIAVGAKSKSGRIKSETATLNA